MLTARRTRAPTAVALDDAAREATPSTIAKKWVLAASVFCIWVALLGTYAVLRSSWLHFTLTSTNAGWSQLRNPHAAAYEQNLLLWPLAAYILVGAMALVLTASVSVRWEPVRTKIACICAVAGVGAGLVAALMGVRYVAFTLARAFDSGPTMVRPGIVPWLNLALGACLACAGLIALAKLVPNSIWSEPRIRAYAWAGAMGWVGLATACLPPYPYLPVFEQRFHLDELAVAVFGLRNPGVDAATALAISRGAAGTIVVLALVLIATLSLAPGASAATISRLKHGAWLLVAAALVGLVAYGLYWDGLNRLAPGSTFASNAALPLTFLVFAAIGLHALRHGRVRG